MYKIEVDFPPDEFWSQTSEIFYIKAISILSAIYDVENHLKQKERDDRPPRPFVIQSASWIRGKIIDASIS